MTNLLALDPGGTTGWSTWTYDATTPLLPAAHGMIEGGLQGFFRWWDAAWSAQHFRTYKGALVVEDFVLDGRTAQPDTTALEIIGALELLARQMGIPLVRQMNDQKRHAPDALLERHDLWWEGDGHDRDSARHAIAYMKTRRHGPTIARYSRNAPSAQQEGVG